MALQIHTPHKTMLAILVMITGMSNASFAQTIEAAFQLTQTKPPLLKNAANENDGIPATQKVVFPYARHTGAFTRFSVFSIQTKKPLTVEYKTIDTDFLKKQQVQALYLAGDTVYRFALRTGDYYYGKDAAETEKDRQAIITLAEAFAKSLSYNYKDSSTETRLLYILNGTTGTQQHLRDGFQHISWHTWAIKNRALTAELFGIEHDNPHKCTFTSSRITIPLDDIDSFSLSNDEHYRIQVNMKENKFVRFQKMNKMKGECDKDKWYGAEDETKAGTIKVASEWAMGHISMTVQDLNNWLKAYQKN